MKTILMTAMCLMLAAPMASQAGACCKDKKACPISKKTGKCAHKKCAGSAEKPCECKGKGHGAKEEAHG